jgi:hypothetical protein
LKGAPRELIGTWGTGESCRAHHRKESLHRITRNEWTDCSAKGCWSAIDKHRKIRGGYVLTQRVIKMGGGTASFTGRIKVLNKNTIWVDDEPGPGFRLDRCTMDHAIAGIGRSSSEGPTSFTPDEEQMFAALYALEVPWLCPKLKVDNEIAERLAEAARTKIRADRQSWQAQRATGPQHQSEPLPEEPTRSEAKRAVIADNEGIPSFCQRALNAFGVDGRVLPSLLSLNPDGAGSLASARSSRPSRRVRPRGDVHPH